MPKGDLAAEIRQAIADEKMTKTQLYRAGVIAGLRECAELAYSSTADGASLDERSALLVLAQAIRARIAALETEEGR